MSASSRNYNTPRSEVSQEDERELNPDLLLMHDLYENSNPKHIGHYFANSIIIAEETIKLLIDKTFKVMKEKYYESKMNPHILDATHNLLELVLTSEMIFSDDTEFPIYTDEEAERPTTDNWSRNKIISKKHDLSHDQHSVSYISESVASTLHEGKKVLQKAHEEARRFITELDPSTIPMPVAINEEVEKEDKLFDDLRDIKERERLRALQAKQDALLNAAKPKKTEYSVGKKPYTFDYDGNIIVTKGVKIEKLPQPALHVNYSLPTLSTQEIIEREKLKKKDILPTKTKTKFLPDHDKFGLTKYVPETHDVFHLFNPAKGVKISENGREKYGDYYDAQNAMSYIDGSLVSNDGAPVRLTKEEYYSITHDGVLRRRSEMKQNYSDQRTTNKSEESYKDLLSNNSREEPPKGSKYTKILNPELLESLNASAEPDPYNTVKLPVIMQKSTSFTKAIPRSPIDNFNIEILKSKDWGKPGMIGSIASPPTLPKNKKEIAKGLTYSLVKQPRDRYPHMKKKSIDETH